MCGSLQFILDLFDLLLDLLRKLPKNVRLLLNLVTLGGGQSTLSKDAVQTSELLRYPVIVRAQLVKDAHVVLGVCFLSRIGEGLDLLLDLLGDVGDGSTACDLGHERVKRLNGTSNGIKTTTGDSVGSGMLIDPVNKGLLTASTFVGYSLLAASREPLNGWVGLDTLLLSHCLAVGSFGIDLGDQDILLVNECVGEVFPGRGKALAVWNMSRLVRLNERMAQEKLTSAPRSGKSDENMLVATNGLGKCRIVEVGNLAGQLELLLGFYTGLLNDEIGQALKVAARLVILRFAALAIEELKGRETLDTKSLTELTLSVSVDLGDLDLVLCVLVGIG